MGFFDSLFGRSASWKRVSPEGWGYSIEFPAEPNRVPATVQGEAPTPILGRTHDLHAVASDRTALFMVQCQELQFDPARAPGGPQAALLALLPPKQTTGSRQVFVDGHPGYSEETSEALRYCYLVGQRLYALVVVPMGPNFHREAAERFFRSFQLVGAPLTGGPPPPEGALSRPKLGQFVNLLFEIPEGWRAFYDEEQKCLVIESAATHRLGSIEKRDNFVLTATPAGGRSVEEHVQEALQMMGDRTQIAAALRRALPNVDDEVLLRLTGENPRPLDLGGVKALAIDGASMISKGDLQIVFTGPRVFIVYADVLYIVAARYALQRQSAVALTAESFVSKLRLNRSALN